MRSENFAFDDFLRHRAVSRETFSKLEEFVALLSKWQKTINLVSPASLAEVWMRHIMDSAQLMDYLDTSEPIVDLGSGAGFPGLVIAIMGLKNITLVESDRRKAAFLQEAARVTGTEVTIICQRVEHIDINIFSIIIARAFAPLGTLLNLIGASLNAHHKMLLLKGKEYKSEIAQAQQDWHFEYTVYPSATDKSGVILSLKNLKRTRAT